MASSSRVISFIGKLAFDELEDSAKRFLGEDLTQLQFGPAQHGDILATELQPPFATLDGALQLVKEATGALLRVGEYTTAVQINSNGAVRLLDPHAWDDSEFVSCNGTALIIKFKDTVTFHTYLKCFVKSNGTGHSTNSANNTPSVPNMCHSFKLMPLFVSNVK